MHHILKCYRWIEAEWGSFNAVHGHLLFLTHIFSSCYVAFSVVHRAFCCELYAPADDVIVDISVPHHGGNVIWFQLMSADAPRGRSELCAVVSILKTDQRSTLNLSNTPHTLHPSTQTHFIFCWPTSILLWQLLHLFQVSISGLRALLILPMSIQKCGQNKTNTW